LRCANGRDVTAGAATDNDKLEIKVRHEKRLAQTRRKCHSVVADKSIWFETFQCINGLT
jgi:hypothetical protein